MKDAGLGNVPEDARDVVTATPSRVAGGIPAITSTLKHALRQMGFLRGMRTLLKTNQMGGFDCPGCAWPEPDKDRTAVEFCENGAKAVASEATTRRITLELFAQHSVAELAEKSDFWLNEQGRLTRPMVLERGATHYTPIGWDAAFALVAQELHALASPDEALFYTSGRTSNEAAFVYQLFARMLGTNNLPDCSNMCHESSGAALGESLGTGKGTVTLDDFDVADAIFLIGQNPGTNHPRMLTTLEAAAKRGCTIVGINPLAEPGTMRFSHPQDVVDMLGTGTKLAALHLPVRVNGDVALLRGIAKEMLEEEARSPGAVVDRAFVDEHTEGFEAYARSIRDESWDLIVEVSGVPRDLIARAARVAIESKATIVCWAMGLTQHKNAVANIQEIVNVLLLRGSIGRPGAGVCPVRGHSNVQGDRTMGVGEKMPDEFLTRLGEELGFEPPRKHGKDTVDAIRAMRDGHAKVFFGLGGNFLSATPDTHETARALARCALTVQVSTKLNRAHLVTGARALILPCLGRTERDISSAGEQIVTTENSMGVVQTSRGSLEPASPMLKSEVAIVCGVAKATLGGARWDALAARYDTIRDLVERVIPGFEDFNARVRKPGGFYLPNPARERIWHTPSGKARFFAHGIEPHALAKGQLLMMTIRSHDQYNTTVYGMDDRYRGIRGGRRVVLMNADDVAELGLAPDDLVDLTSHFSGQERTLLRFRVVVYDIPRRCAATYFPEANALVPLDSVALKSNTPTSKSVVISVRRSDVTASGDRP